MNPGLFFERLRQLHHAMKLADHPGAAALRAASWLQSEPMDDDTRALVWYALGYGERCVDEIVAESEQFQKDHGESPEDAESENAGESV